MNAIEKYNHRAQDVNSLVCVGLDSDMEKIPDAFHRHDLPQFTFNRQIIEQTAEFVAAYKLNTAFYEAQGEQGWLALRQTTDYLSHQHPNILIICDAKRADIGNTAAAYARAVFDVLGCDAVTLNPYLGQEALEPFLRYETKGCIVLCRTSNPGGGELQDLEVGGQPLWQIIARKVAHEWNRHGNCMLVMGATYPDELRQVRALAGEMTLLIPGVGAQGGRVDQVVHNGLNTARMGIILNSSRDILFADDPRRAVRELRDTINLYRG